MATPSFFESKKIKFENSEIEGRGDGDGFIIFRDGESLHRSQVQSCSCTAAYARARLRKVPWTRSKSAMADDRWAPRSVATTGGTVAIAGFDDSLMPNFEETRRTIAAFELEFGGRRAGDGMQAMRMSGEDRAFFFKSRKSQRAVCVSVAASLFALVSLAVLSLDGGKWFPASGHGKPPPAAGLVSQTQMTRAPRNGINRLPPDTPQWTPAMCMIDVGQDGGAQNVATLDTRNSREECTRKQLYQGVLLQGEWTPGSCRVRGEDGWVEVSDPSIASESGCTALHKKDNSTTRGGEGDEGRRRRKRRRML